MITATAIYYSIAMVSGGVAAKVFMGNPIRILNLVLNDPRNSARRRAIFTRAMRIQNGIIIGLGIIGLFLSTYLTLFAIGALMTHLIFTLPKIRNCIQILDKMDMVYALIMAKLSQLNSMNQEGAMPDGPLYYTFDGEGLVEMKLENTITDTEKDKNDK